MTHTTFLALFLKHWDAGTRLAAHKARLRGSWTTGDFVGAMAKAECPVSEDAVETWRSGKHLPRRPQMLAILDVLFPAPGEGCPEHPDRNAMFHAWDAAQRPQAKRAKAAPEPVAESKAEDAADWPRENPPPFSGLVALELLPPHADNETGGHRLRCRLVLGAREDESTKQAVLVTIRPEQAFLALEAPKGAITEESLIGVREAHAHLKEAPGGLRVTGPQASLTRPDGATLAFIEGEVFGGSHLALLTGAHPGLTAEVTVTVSVGKRGFDVTPLDEEGRPAAGAIDSEAKQALLNALISSVLPTDGQGRAVVQTATLRRRPKE